MFAPQRLSNVSARREWTMADIEKNDELPFLKLNAWNKEDLIWDPSFDFKALSSTKPYVV